MNDLTHLSLFTGIGGIDLAAEWAGFRTIGQVEQNLYALRVLRNRFGRRIPRWTDIKDLTADNFKRRTGIDSPTIITGGFPCQPFSCAGKRRGKEDDRYLWPEMLRVVRELRPDWVLGENVAGIVSMELEPCCADLEGEGYTVRAFLVPACGVGAWHRRERVFIIGSNTRYHAGSTEQECEPHIPQKLVTGCTGQLHSEDISNTNSQGLQERNRINFARGPYPPTNRCGWWDVEPTLGRLAHGVPHRVDRLRCLGNAVVPQQVYPILAGIAQIELSEAM
jgi:DNA (cytosine-5)-methyltransferase 1